MVKVKKITKNFLKTLEKELKDKTEIENYFNDNLNIKIGKIDYDSAKKLAFEEVIKKLAKNNSLKKEEIKKILKNRLPFQWGVYTLFYIYDIMKGNRIFKKYKMKEKLKLDKKAKDKGFYQKNTKKTATII